MSRWTTIFASIAISSFCLPAIAANNDPPRNIELKPGAASPYAAGQTAADTSSGTTTRQIVTEGKDAPAEAAVPAPPPPPPPGLRPEEVIVAVQTELKRVGCDPGAIDGDWGGRSREALAAFGHFAKVDVGKLAPSPEILEVIKGKAEVVCAGPAPAPEPEHHAAPPPHDDYGGGGYGGGGGGGY